MSAPDLQETIEALEALDRNKERIKSETGLFEWAWGRSIGSAITLLKAQQELCEHCGLPALIDDCMRCGAPVCCSHCCEIDTLKTLLKAQQEQIVELEAENKRRIQMSCEHPHLGEVCPLCGYGDGK